LKRLKRETKSGHTVALSAVSTEVRHKGTNWKLLKPVGVAAIAIAVWTFFYSHRATVLSEKDTIVLADFDNKTGDTVFDETLKQALAVQLQQSPYLKILSDRKVATTLRLMGRSPDQPIAGEIARELCERVGSNALLRDSKAIREIESSKPSAILLDKPAPLVEHSGVVPA
jgi:hypothetical protein